MRSEKEIRETLTEIENSDSVSDTFAQGIDLGWIEALIWVLKDEKEYGRDTVETSK